MDPAALRHSVTWWFCELWHHPSKALLCLCWGSPACCGSWREPFTGLEVRGLPRLLCITEHRITWRLLQRGAAEVPVPIFPNSMQKHLTGVAELGERRMFVPL